MENVNQDQKESVKSNAKTIEDAIKQGLQQLNLSRDQVEIEIIKEGTRGGLFGLLGGEDAVVRLTPKSEPKPIENTTTLTNNITDVVNVDSEKEAPATEAAKASVTSSSHPDNSNGLDPEIKERAKDVLRAILDKMSIIADVSIRMGTDLVETGENPPLTLDITGDDLGLLIGRRGETLQALQFVVRQILSKEVGRWVPIVVDVESYLVRRRKSLQQLASRMADRVAFSQRKVILEPMSSKERRIVHLQLRDHEKVYTSSIGDRGRRKVIILPK